MAQSKDGVAAATKRASIARLALLVRASSVALVAAAAFANAAYAKPPSANSASGNGGIGRNPNDLKDGEIDGNAGNGHHGSPPPPVETSCDGGEGVVGLVTITNATPMPLTGNIECVTVDTTIDHGVASEAIVGDPGAGYSSFVVGTDGIIEGELWNDGTITGGYANLAGSGLGALTILGDVQGGLRNTGVITSPGNNGIQVGSSSDSVLLPGKIEGGISNDGSIAGLNDGIAMIAGSLTGGLTNAEHAKITGGNAAVYIADSFSSWTGGITNSGSLHGNGVGILIGAPGATNVEFSGGITNSETGVISSGEGPAIFASGASYAGGLTNYGLITETGEEFAEVYGGSAVILDAVSVSGDIANHGTIEGVLRQGLLITDNVDLFSGSVSNTGEIVGQAGGVVVLAHTVNGNFSNTGFVNGGANTGAAYFNSLLEGAGGEGAAATFTNTGTIAGAAGFVVNATTVHASFTNGDAGTGAIVGNTSAGVVLAAQSWTGDVTNNGSISGATVGVAVGYDPFLGTAPPDNTLTGSFVNNGLIQGGTAGVVIAVDAFTGNVTNNGSITGGQYGLAIEGGGNFEGSFLAASCLECVQPFSVGGGTFTGNVTNNDFMSGNTALLVSHDTFSGNLSNTSTGILLGTNYGLLLDVDDFQGNLSNAGTITAGGEGSGIAMQLGAGSTEGGTVLSSQSFSGDISNTGLIHGQNTGLGMVLDSYAGGEGGFTNSGIIAGDNWTGVYIRANQWTGDFTNESSGRIVGGVTGVYIGAATIDGDFTNHGYVEGGLNGVFVNAGTIVGNFSNDGTIAGNSFDTGWNIWTTSFSGNIDNGTGGLLTAPSNALHLRIDAFSGQITNGGVISAPSGNAVAIEGLSTNGIYTGAFTNTGTVDADNIGINLNGAKLTGGIVNDGGTISGATAISTYNATGTTTITNTGGGVILGDLRLSNNFADTFLAQDGGIVGDIIGDPGSGGEGGSNDDSVLIQNGAHYFIGKASNLSSFTVDDGGVALMGATSEGDASGGGFASSNVGTIAVNNGGTLYIDKTASLNAGSYTQQSGGTLEFYLGAPGGANFTTLTGTEAAVAGTDYGQIHISGSANLDGSIAGFLDPTFASANSALDAVVYNDVLIADGGITGDFTTLALISNSNLFELNEEIDGNTVDLTVTRASLGQIGDIGTVVVETGGPWKAMVNDRTNGIGSGSCSLAGSGWCLNAYAANEAGGPTVMNDATPGADPFGWLRTGTRREDETAVWGRIVGVWGDTSGDANHDATEFNTYGGIVGIDHVFTPIFLAGAAAQWTRSKIDFAGSPDNASIKSLEVGGYMSYGDARFYVNANSSVIFHQIEVTRFAPGGSAESDYDGATVSGYAEAGRIFETYEGFRIQPLVALSYAHLDTDAYNETGSATTLLHVFDADLDSLKSLLGARVAYPIAIDAEGKMVPEARVIWSHEFLDDHSAFDANPISNPLNIATIAGQVYNRDSLVVGAGMTAPLSRATSLFLDYDANLNENITTHTVSGGLRARW